FYRRLLSFESAEFVYDATVAFCRKFVGRGSRTVDQMVQAARSGKQNIAEASQASATSKKTEVRLTGVARASLQELLEDYHDFLRHNKMELWAKTDPRVKAIRDLARSLQRSYEDYRALVESGTAEVAANTVVCLIHQTCFLLDRQIRRLEKDFLEEGGFSEKLYRARRQKRGDEAQRGL
ncbi:MAG: four helix bundle protein, partial [Deltaproteobacteria bacterium]|nr:four helix bundle protein [Deltaproteobacteria bacterium]